MLKVYCFVDESGQDTVGKYFYVVAVLINDTNLEQLRLDLLKVEKDSNKRKAKWGSANHIAREKYFVQIIPKLKQVAKIYYAKFKNTTEYPSLTALTIAESVACYSAEFGDVDATITIDGLRKSERENISKTIRRLKVRFRSIRGANDISEPIIRLADSVAGLVRDCDEGKLRVPQILRKLEKEKLISCVKE